MGHAEGLLETPRAVWERLVETGAVRPGDYDQELVEALGTELGLGAGLHVGPALEDADVSMEDFLGALLGIVEPFSRMMSELCSFFERHDVLGTGEGLRIRVNFEGTSELTFDLTHFRRWLKAWTEATGIVEVPAWTYDTVWRPAQILHEALGEAYQNLPGDPAAARWVTRNTYHGRDHGGDHYGPPPSPPPTGDPRIERVVDHVMQMVHAVVDACAPYGNYAALEGAAKEQDWPVDASAPTPLGSWGLVRLRQLDSDYFVGSTVSLLWRWVERMEVSAGRDPAASAALRLEKLFESLPTMQGLGKVRLERLVEFLNLPAWRARHALYQAWMVAAVEAALSDYPIEVHHQDGTLVLGPNAPPVATFKSADDSLVLLTEHRTPLATPVGTGRLRAMQPDYSIAPAGDHDSALVVIETKQYRKASAGNFVDAMTDYARGQPGARVILATYGAVSASVLPQVPEVVRPRCFPVGEVRPDGRGRSPFEGLLREALPFPPPHAHGPPAVEGLQGIVVDVSASMRDALRHEAVLQDLRLLARSNPDATWIAADTEIRRSVEGLQGLDVVLGTPTTGGTNLPSACVELDLRRWVVVTDEEGLDQLLDAGQLPQSIGVVSGPRIQWRPMLGPNASPSGRDFDR